MLENYKTDKLHHPSNNDTKTMQKQCCFFLSNKFQAGMAKFAFFLCVHMLCMLCFTHTLHTVGKCKLTQFPQK